MDKNLQNLYADLILEYQSGFNPPQRVPNQVVPKEAGTKLSHNKQVIGIAPPMVTSTVYGEQEEEPSNILKIIKDIEVDISDLCYKNETNSSIYLQLQGWKENLLYTKP